MISSFPSLASPTRALTFIVSPIPDHRGHMLLPLKRWSYHWRDGSLMRYTAYVPVESYCICTDHRANGEDRGEHAPCRPVAHFPKFPVTLIMLVLSLQGRSPQPGATWTAQPATTSVSVLAATRQQPWMCSHALCLTFLRIPGRLVCAQRCPLLAHLLCTRCSWDPRIAPVCDTCCTAVLPTVTAPQPCTAYTVHTPCRSFAWHRLYPSTNFAGSVFVQTQ